MRILALVAARGGSKRLPGKNIRLLGGKPLITWSIDAVKDIPEISDILVSTDEPSIAKISKAAGAYVPWLRPAELATDNANSSEVALHALDWYETKKGKVDGVLLLQPTSPFRTKATIEHGIALFEKHGKLPVVGVSPTHTHPFLFYKLEGGLLAPFMRNHDQNITLHELPQAHVVNGSFYLIKPSELRACHSFIGLKTIPLVVESMQEAIDIDTEWDFNLAEFIFENYLCKLSD
jgi:CMP-N-acetylneuraminic acid synthetase